MTTETHPFPPFIPAEPHFLVLGSFPCFNGVDYGNWFYSGSGRNDFWPLLSKVFGMPANTRSEKEQLCTQQAICITDIAQEISRTKGNCSDANLKIYQINTEGIQACLAAQPGKILFTSKFVEKLFQKHFPQVSLPTYTLLSPSPAIDRYLGGREKYQKLMAAGKIRGPFDYKLLQYRQAFTH